VTLTLFDIPRLFEYQFFRNALLGGIITAVVCAWIGLFLILRKESMLVDGVAHTSFGGIALGLFLGINPILTALLITILAVLGISWMRRLGMAHSDSATAVMLALGFSTGLIIISLADGFNVELMSYLFGSILTIDQADLRLVGALAVITFVFLGIFYKELLSITFDEDASRLMGIPVRPLSIGYNILIAVTKLGLSFKGTTIAAMCFGASSVFTGMILSAIYDVATSGVIVFTMTGIFLFVAAYRRLE
jgi:zinc transport system permease protein